MQKSQNYGFYLPSRDTDDIVDVNQISDNFRIIDENIPSNNSTKDDIYNNVSNSLKSTKSGAVITADDVSPLEHNLKVKLTSDTVTDLTTVTVKSCGKNLFDNNKLAEWGLTLTDGKYVGFVSNLSSKTLVSNLKSNTQYTISLKGFNINSSEASALIDIFYTDGTNQTGIRLTSTSEREYNFTSTADKTISRISVYYYNADAVNISYIQIEEGTIATDYEAYKGTDYTPNFDGTVEGVKSLYPTTTLMTDTEGVIIEAEYNRDINKALAELQQAVLSMGGNT